MGKENEGTRVIGGISITKGMGVVMTQVTAIHALINEKMPTVISNPVIQTTATIEINAIVDAFMNKTGILKGAYIQLGDLSDILVNEVKRLSGLEIQGKALYTSTKTLTHHRTGQKLLRGKVVPMEDFRTLAVDILKMDIYEKSGALVFTDYKNKYVVKVNQKIKVCKGKDIVANHISSSRVTSSQEFSSGYSPIKKTR
ncbi:MAG: hypothetical protein IJ202_07540 [Bacteroidales bacterium]|nr:hypothetical protein [Bacteroidales bacterium]MBQ9172604.1 hypothetical protein [Bacteroidales bacterium]